MVARRIQSPARQGGDGHVPVNRSQTREWRWRPDRLGGGSGPLPAELAPGRGCEPVAGAAHTTAARATDRGLSVPYGSMSAMNAQSPAIPEYAERVLAVAELIPPGQVLTYGDIAEWLEDGGPRQVGRVMALYGGAVPWWRVIRADGALLPGSERRALAHYRAEGTPLREASRTGPGASLPRVDMRRARWDGHSR